MAEQTVQQPTNTIQKRQIAVFDNRNAAEKAKEILQKSDVDFNDIRIEGEITPYEEVAAMGTTVGAEAGFLIGAFLGGTIGVIFVTVYSTFVYGEVINTSFNQLAIAIAVIAGAIFGVFIGKQVRNANLPEQKQKGNPNAARRFSLWVEANDEALNKADEILGYSAAS